MKYFLVLILLQITLAGLAQKTVDTTVLYNSEMTKKRTVFTTAGEISKETYYYNSGKIKIEYFYFNGKQIHWIAYDQSGKITSEWADPGHLNAKFIHLRNLSFLFSLICLTGLMIVLSNLNYVNTYYSFFLFSVVYPLIIMLLERKLFTDKNQIIPLVLLSVLIISPFILLTLSIVNIIRKKYIPLIVSIFGILVSLGFLFFFWVAMNVSGAGILG